MYIMAVVSIVVLSSKEERLRNGAGAKSEVGS